MLRVVVALSVAVMLHAASNLGIDRIALHQFEDGPVLPTSYELLPGETAHFSCRIKGYQIDKSDEEDQKVKLSWKMEVLDPNGVLLEKPKAGRIDGRVAPEDKNWLPKFLAEFAIPPFASSGDYRVSVQIKDEVGSSDLHSELVFHVRGHDVQASDNLATHNFHFLRSEEDGAPLRDPVYHPGEVLWARFDIVGYKLADANRFSVDYGLAVLGSDGKQLFSQPEAAADSHESFYPQRYVPGALSLNLEKNVPAANYTLVVTVRDKIGNQTWEERQPFRVE
jgi:hypothetical protein